MEFLVCIIFILLIVVLVILLMLVDKIKKLDYLLQRKIGGEMIQQAPPVPQQMPPPMRDSIPAMQNTDQPLPRPVIVMRPEPPKSVTENTVPQPALQQKTPSVWENFIEWFWTGNAKGKEGVTKEYAIATTWLMRAGVLVLLCGIGFFLKYSIEKDLISPAVRISSASLFGILMFIGGYLMLNKRFHILAVGILSAGVITLYMSFFAGYKLYHLIPLGLSFVLMVLVTAAAMLVSVKKNLLPVALTGCTGAYLIPVLLSNDSGNLPGFMGYIAFVSAGILIVSRERRWRSLEAMGFCFSFLLMGYGLIELSHRINWWCLGFLFLNYLIFSLIPLIRKKEFPSGRLEWLLPILSTAITLGGGIFIIDEMMSEYQNIALAAYAVLLAAISMGEGLWLNRKEESGKKMLPAFLSASILSLALAVPLALENAGAILSGWSILGLVLVLAADRSRLKTLLVLSGIIFAGVFISLISVLVDSPETAAFSTRFFQCGVFALSMIGSAILLRKHLAAAEKESFFADYCRFYSFAGGAVLFLYTSYEVYHNLDQSGELHFFRHGGLSIWWAIIAISLIIWGIRKSLKTLRIIGLALFLICIVKVYCIDIAGLETLGKVIAFLVLGLLFLGAATAYILFRKRFDKEES